jgi:hypothetical protein
MGCDWIRWMEGVYTEKLEEADESQMALGEGVWRG